MAASRFSTEKATTAGQSIAAAVTGRKGLAAPAVPVFQKQVAVLSAIQAPIVQKAVVPGAAGIEMTIEPTSTPNANIAEYDYSKGIDPIAQTNATTMYWDLWNKLDTAIDNILANPLAAPNRIGVTNLKKIRQDIPGRDQSKTHTPIVNWHKAAIPKVNALTDPGAKGLKKTIDEMLVLSNLINDMGDANNKQLAGTATAIRAFYLSNDPLHPLQVLAMATVDMSNAVPYIMNAWGQGGAGKLLMEGLPSKLGVTTFSLHAIDEAVAILYEKNYKGKRIT